MRRTIASLSILAILIAALLIQTPSVRGISSTVVISEFRTRGLNGGSDEFVELHNLSSSPVDISGWKLRASNASGTVGTRATILPGTMLNPGCFYLLTNSSASGGPYSGPVPGNQTYATGITDDGGLAVTLPSDIVVDQAGMSAGSAFKEGMTLAPLTTNLNRGYERLPGGAAGHTQDTDNNATDFQLITPSNPQNLSSTCIMPAVETDPAGAGAASPNIVEPAGLTLLTVNVTPGMNPTSTDLQVTADLSAIGGPAMQMFFDDGTHGDATAGDSRFSFLATVASGTAVGPKMLAFTITDAQARMGSGNIQLTVVTPTGVVISEFRTRGPNSGNDEFIELYNRTTSPVNVGGWKLRGSNVAAAVSTRATIPGGTVINPGCHYLLVNSGAYSGMVAGDQAYSVGITDDGGIALTQPNDSPVDQVGMSGGSAFKEGTTLAPLSGAANQSYERRPGGSQGSGVDTNDNAADFQLLLPSDPQNSLSPCIPITTTTVPFGIANANPDLMEPGGTTLLTVAVTPGQNPTSTGLMVQADLSSITGSAMQMFFDDGMNGDVTAGDNTFSFLTTVPAGTAPGDKNIPVTVADAQSRSSSTSIQLVVLASLTINQIQGAGQTSDYTGLVVRTRGVVTGRKVNGFFIQTPDGSLDDDGNAATSEGLFVFTGGAPPAEAVVGNRVSVTGAVQEFVPGSDPQMLSLTEIAGDPSVAVEVLAAGQALPAPITLTAADTNPAGTLEQMERFEGMRVHVASLTVVGPTDGFPNSTRTASTSNGLFFGVITGVPRPFREPGIERFEPVPPGTPMGAPRFDGNPERLRVDSDGILGAIIDVNAGAVLTNVVGPLDFGFRTWTILPDPASPPVVTGIHGAVPVPAAGSNEFTVGSFNLERFFNDVNDPGISEPVLTAAQFDHRLGKASMAIRNGMGMPDILGVQEVENLATLQALADRINADAMAAGQGNPHYQPHVFEGNDPGGIDVGFLVKASRVAVIEVTQEGKEATFINPNNGQPELTNDRPPLVLRAQVLTPLTLPLDVTVVVNHLRSFIGINDPADPADSNRVRHKRRAQAEFLANVIQQHQTANPNASIISIGDYNAFPFNDGLVDSMGTIQGTPAPANEVLLASPDLVNPDLTDLVNLIDAEQRYSFLFDGNGQVLDHILVTANLLQRFSRFHYARNNADFPEVLRGDGARPERLSDHDMPVAYFILPPRPVFLLIDEDSIDNGQPPNFFSTTDVNDHRAEIGVRSQLPFFAARVDQQVTLYAGQVGDEGWFALKTVPAAWTTAGPSGDGLRNFLGNPSQGFPHNVGPGLGVPNANGDREALLDKIPDVTPLRATGLSQLTGQQVCAVVYDGDISMNYSPLNGSLKGANLGVVAFEVLRVRDLAGFSSSSLPLVDVRILDANRICEGPLRRFIEAPEPN